jgi:hypothetical protein
LVMMRRKRKLRMKYMTIYIIAASINGKSSYVKLTLK